jgi:hypothetical protein
LQQELYTHVPVDGQFTDLPKGIVLVRPDLGHVENVPFVALGILEVHDLDIDVPYRIVTFLDRVEQILQQMIWVLASNFGCFLSGKVLDALLGLDMDLDVFEGAILECWLAISLSATCFRACLFGKLVSMSAIGVQVADRRRGSSIAE